MLNYFCLYIVINIIKYFKALDYIICFTFIGIIIRVLFHYLVFYFFYEINVNYDV